MAWECKNRFWPGTHTYMVSNRTNPAPASYVNSLTAAKIKVAEKNNLIICVRTWPGGNPTVAALTVKDIELAKTTG